MSSSIIAAIDGKRGQIMNFEQACRFATSDSGYRIFAQSDGFSEQSANGMTSIFNDVMNPVFGKVGQSMITLNVSNKDAFFARLTLRSDIKSRKSMFTNAAVIPIDFYSRMMSEDPCWMLQFPYSDLLSQNPGNARMNTIEMGEYEPEKDALDNICREFELEKADLTEFVMQLYKAVMGGTSLCLDTNLESSRTPDLIVKYAALAATLLPPSVRNTFTFSSMGDARCTLCVQPGDGGELLNMGRDIYRFQTDKKNRIIFNNAARPVDMHEGMMSMFINFANLLSDKLLEDRAELEDILRGLDEAADRIAGIRRGNFSFELLMISYYLTPFRNISLIEAVYLINALLQYSQANPTNDRNVNALLTEWVNLLSAEKVCANINITAPLTVRAIDQKDEHLYNAVKQMLKAAADETRTGLAQIVLQKECSRFQKDLVNELLIENPAAWSDELLETLLLWSCRNNITDLADVIWSRKNTKYSTRNGNVSETEELLHRLLKDNAAQEKEGKHRAKGKSLFNECEMFYMSRGLAELCDCVNSKTPEEILRDDEVSLMNNHYGEFSEQLRENWIAYLRIFKYCAGKPVDKQIRSLKEMNSFFPRVFQDICTALQQDKEDGHALLEAYWTDTLIDNCNSLNDLVNVCNQYNISLDPKGIMENEVRRKWLTMTAFYSGKPPQNEMGSLMRQYELLDGAKISAVTRLNLKDEITLRFWKCIKLDALLNSALGKNSIDFMRRCMEKQEHQPHTEISAKMTAFYYIADAFLNPEKRSNHAFFAAVVETGEWSCVDSAKDFKIFRSGMHKGDLYYSKSDINAIQQAILKVAEFHLRTSDVFYIDYLLFGTYYWDEKRPDDEGYDFEEFRIVLDGMIKEGVIRDSTQIRLEDSYLLYGEDADPSYRKGIRKLITKNDPLSLLEFSDRLREPKKGILGFFGRKNYSEGSSYRDDRETNIPIEEPRRKPRKR